MSLLEGLPNPADLVTNYWWFGLLLYLTGVGLPIPEEITLVFAGAALYQARMDAERVFAVAIVAILMADTQVYLIGRFVGRRVLEMRLFRLLMPPARIEKAERRFGGHSLWAIFTVRFVMALRGPTYFVAGMLRVSYLKFVLTDCVAALAHVAAYVTLGYMFSQHVDSLVTYIRRADRWVGLAAMLAVIFVVLFTGYGIGKWRKRK